MARKLSEEAVALDPTYATAYAMIAWSDMLDVLYGGSKSPKESLEKAFQLIQKSLSLESTCALPYVAMSFGYLMKRQHEKAIGACEQALQFDPNDAFAYAMLSLVLTYSGKAEEALAPMERALRLNPKPPANYFLYQGVAYYHKGMFEEAFSIWKKAAAISPNAIDIRLRLADCYSALGREDEAREEVATILKLVALGKEPMAECIHSDPSAIPLAGHEQILKELRNYFFIGGMPECVAVWRDTNSLTEVGQVQSEIISSLRDDFSKYTPQIDPACLDAVLLSVAKRVGEQLKYTRLNEKHTGPTNRKGFDLLTKAKITHRIPACNPSGLPLGATANPRKFKAALVDIGLMQRLCQLPIQPEMLNENLLSIYRGKLAKQYVAQEMAAAGNGELFYWAREAHASSAEIDYLAVREGKIYPVEVKSGAAGTLRSLHLMLNIYPNCPEGIVLSTRPYSRLPEQRLSFLPLYYAAGLNRKWP